MSKQIRIRVGDKVRWEPFNPNEFTNNRQGIVLSIKDGYAIISKPFDDKRTRKVPISRLTKVN